jgi:hypothetical protein
MSRDYGWRQVWAGMSDQELEDAARDYFWLSEHIPPCLGNRIEEIIAETSRRGRPDILQRAKKGPETPRVWRRRGPRPTTRLR